MHAKRPDHPVRPPVVYPLLFFGLMSFSISPILVRFAAEAPGLAVAVWRTGLAVLMLAPFALPRIGAEVRAFTPRERLLIIVAGVMLGLHFVTWIESLYHTSVASASVILSVTPLLLGLFGYWLLGEPLTRRLVASILLAMTGTALIAWGDSVDERAVGSLFGNGLALAAACFQCFYLLIGRVIRRRTSWLAYVFPLYLVAALTTLATALLRGVSLLGYDPIIYVLCGLMALLPQITGHGSFNYALRYFTAALLGLLALTEPVIASWLAYLLFDEMPTGIALAGMVVVLVSVAVVLIRRRPARVETI
ncbi:DMT family transporter [Rhodocaloribacter litoris]|uniref:DMT family transporter n=1 Tax=Rhodocaloribacter litoris TaxID=2558931 RepID=UPI00142247A0|nr:DMT family transporter [Rhodocaloribacter litoris]QXD15302.1 DMT family transporter [Rhodocaloribacter litoris]